MGIDMKYKKVIEGEFVSRPNRFIAKVIIDGKEETVHVKNTGRCKELLLKGTKVYLSVSDNPQRKTKYDLIAVEKARADKLPLLINMDSQAPNEVVYEWLKEGNLFSEDAVVKREVKFGDSRFDFYVEDKDRKAFLEVKGVTLENDGEVMFPDAPTERGVKHINELIKCKNDDYEAYIIFVIQMKDVTVFKPNDLTHKAFGETLRKAESKGVKIIALDCKVTPDTMIIDEFVNVKL